MRNEHAPSDSPDDLGLDHDESRNPPLSRPSANDALRGCLSNGSLRLEVFRMVLATVAFVSTKYILVDLYFHYPLHLLVAQLLSLLVISATLDLAASQTTSAKLSWLAHTVLASQPSFVRSKASNLASISLALSLPLLAQAILHFPNLPTISMLIIFAFTSEFACRQAMSSPACQLGFKRVMIPMVLLLFGCSWLILDEYRIESNGLLFSLPAWGLIGLYRAILEAYNIVRNSPQSLRSIDHTLRVIVLMSLAITVSCLLVMESPSQSLSNLKIVPPTILTLNLGSTALSLLLFFGTLDNDDQEKSTHSSLSLAWTLRGVCWAGACAVTSTSFTRPALSTQLQIISLVLPSMSVAALQLLWEGEASRSRRWQRLRSSGRHSRQLSRQNEEGRIGLLAMPPVEGSPSRDEPDLHPTSATKQPISLRHMSTLAGALNKETAFLFISALGLWMLFAFFVMPRANTIHEDSKAFAVRLDHAYVPKVDFDIVVSAYDEPAAFTKDIATRIAELPKLVGRTTRMWIYLKDDTANVEEIKKSTGAAHVVKRPNIGREGETYLYHIDREWDNLALHTLFVQAHVHNAWEFYRRVDQYYNETTGMLSLGFVGHICDCYNCHDRWGFEDNTGTILPDIYKDVMNETCQTPLLAYKGQFIASARRIRGTDRQIFQRLHMLISDPESEVHKPEYLKGRPDSMDAPFFGYTLERLWYILLQCSDYRIAQQCPSVLSGTRRGGNQADCQCLDDIV